MQSILLLSFLLLSVAKVAAIEKVSTFRIFFRHRGDAILDNVLKDAARGRAPYLTKEEMRDLTGLSSIEIDLVKETLKGIGGNVSRVATLCNWAEVEFSNFDIDSNSIKEIFKNTSIQEEVAFIESKEEDKVKPKTKDKKKSMIIDTLEIKHSRQLQQAGLFIPGIEGQAIITALNISKADAIQSLSAWQNVVQFFVICSDGSFEGINGSCLQALNITPTSLYIDGSVPIERFEIPDFASSKHACGDLSICPSPDSALYLLPMNKFTKPNVLYLGLHVEALIDGVATEMFYQWSETGNIYNYFNASASSFRSLYGVDAKYQGNGIIQGTSLNPGFGAAINITAVNEYLDLQDLEHTEINIFNYSSYQLNECGDCDETMLDVQTMQSMAPMASTYFAPGIIKSPNNTADWVDYFEAIIKLDTPPSVISYSWSEDIIDGIETVEEALEILKVTDQGWKKLAGMGVTILVASGDAGASAPQGEACYNDPLDDLGFGGPLIGNRVGPSWPKVSEWMTVVGGTQIRVPKEGGESVEVACSSATDGGITSGGGFAGTGYKDLYRRPSWQETQVQKYLQKNSNVSGFPSVDTPGFASNGRAFPDIAAYAAWFPKINYDGSLSMTAGTSLAAPVVASLFTLANQALLEDGYSTIGYANPMLYWMADNCPEAFQDITIGDNFWNDQKPSPEKCKHGFPAATGWDAVTGLGSIKFDPFVQCAKKYQDSNKTVKPTIAPITMAPIITPTPTVKTTEPPVSSTNSRLCFFACLLTSFSFLGLL